MTNIKNSCLFVLVGVWRQDHRSFTDMTRSGIRRWRRSCPENIPERRGWWDERVMEVWRKGRKEKERGRVSHRTWKRDAECLSVRHPGKFAATRVLGFGARCIAVHFHADVRREARLNYSAALMPGRWKNVKWPHTNARLFFLSRSLWQQFSTFKFLIRQ